MKEGGGGGGIGPPWIEGEMPGATLRQGKEKEGGKIEEEGTNS